MSQPWVIPFCVTWGLDAAYDAALVRASIEFQIRLAELWIGLHPETPDVLAAGVRYSHSDDDDHPLDVPSVLLGRCGDCKDLVAYRVAWLRARSERATYALRDYGIQRGARRYHVLVRRGNGSIEDPSRLLGMR